MEVRLTTLNYAAEPKVAIIMHGKEGTGKSLFLASAFANVKTGEPTGRTGKILDVEGRLGHLRVPADIIEDMRPAYGKPEGIVGDKGKLRTWLSRYLRDINAGKAPYDVIGIDSITELQFLIRLGMAKSANSENSREDEEVLSQRSWGLLGDRLAYDIGYMRPRYTKAHLIVTAYSQDDRDNPKVLEAIERPALQGALADKIGHFFDFIIYVENTRIGRGENAKVVHRYHFTSTGDFKTKNIYEHEGRLPAYIDGTADDPMTFDKMLSYIKTVEVTKDDKNE